MEHCFEACCKRIYEQTPKSLTKSWSSLRENHFDPSLTEKSELDSPWCGNGFSRSEHLGYKFEERLHLPSDLYPGISESWGTERKVKLSLV